MHTIILYKNKIGTKILILFLGTLCFFFGLLIPVSVAGLHLTTGVILLVGYLLSVLILAFRKKTMAFTGRIESISAQKKELKIIKNGFFRHEYNFKKYDKIKNIVLQCEDFSHFTGKSFNCFRYFKLLADVDGKHTTLTKSFFRRTINGIAREVSESLRNEVKFEYTGKKKLIDSKRYHFSNLSYNYSFSPIIYLINAIVWSALLFTIVNIYISVAAISYFLFHYILSYMSLRKARSET